MKKLLIAILFFVMAVYFVGYDKSYH